MENSAGHANRAGSGWPLELPHRECNSMAKQPDVVRPQHCGSDAPSPTAFFEEDHRPTSAAKSYQLKEQSTRMVEQLRSFLS